MRRTILRLLSSFRSSRAETELAREIRSHLQLLEDQYVARGMDADEARYAALRAVRFFWENRTDVIDKKEVVAAAALLLEQADIADLAIEDLRKWQQWQCADQIIALRHKPAFNAPIIGRAILRYALSCPKNDQARQFIEEMRKKDPETVKDAEELLKLETGK